MNEQLCSTPSAIKHSSGLDIPQINVAGNSSSLPAPSHLGWEDSSARRQLITPALHARRHSTSSETIHSIDPSHHAPIPILINFKSHPRKAQLIKILINFSSRSYQTKYTKIDYKPLVCEVCTGRTVPR